MCKVTFIYECAHDHTTFSLGCHGSTVLALDICLLGNYRKCDPSSKVCKVLMQSKIVQALVDGHNITGGCEEGWAAKEEDRVKRHATIDRLKAQSDEAWANDIGSSGRGLDGNSPGLSTGSGSTAGDGGKGKEKATS